MDSSSLFCAADSAAKFQSRSNVIGLDFDCRAIFENGLIVRLLAIQSGGEPSVGTG